MNSTLRPLLIPLAVGFFLLVPLARAQKDPLNDPDLQKMLKEAQELQKESGPANPVKMSDLQKQAASIQKEQRQEERQRRFSCSRDRWRGIAEWLESNISSPLPKPEAASD